MKRRATMTHVKQLPQQTTRHDCAAARVPSTSPLSAVSRTYWHCRNYDYNIDYVTVGCPSVCLSVPSIDIFPLPQPGRGQQISVDSCRRPRLRVASRQQQQQQQQQQNNTNNSIITTAIEGRVSKVASNSAISAY